MAEQRFVALVDPSVDEEEQLVEELPPPIPTGLELTAVDRHFRGSPYPIVADMRERSPVHRDDELRRVFVSRWEDVEPLLRDDELSSDLRKSNKKTLSRRRIDIAGKRALPLQMMDGREHARLRRFVNALLTDAAIDAFRPRISARIRAILDELEDSDLEFEVMGLYSSRVAGETTLEFLGMDGAEYRQFRRRCDAARAAAFNPFRTEADAIAGAAADVELDSALRAEIDKRRARPGDDLITALTKLKVDGDAPSNGEMVQICRLVMQGGVSTMADLITNGLRALLQNTRQMTKLREHPALIDNAVEEVLRFDTPITDTTRIANRDMTIGECPIKRGETITLSIAGANHDERVHTESEAFDIDRLDPKHLSFGAGRHACPGATFARVVAREAILGFIVQFPQSELSPRGWAFSSVPGLRVTTHLWVRT